jgi:DUF4097 and DUF4098 domain-containing protein YvlB
MIKNMSYLTIICLLALAGAGSALAQGAQQFTVPITEPGRPVTLSASLLYGSITVEGHDRGDVVIEVVPEEAYDEDERSEGMKRIPNTSMGLVVEEENNDVEVHGNWASKIEALRIKVPRKTSMELHCTNNGDISVRGVEGELELRNTNGEIEALEIYGSVVAHTTNGEVKVTFLRITPDAPMSFVTFNGDVDVSFPGVLNADLRINAGQGDIFTDFDFKVQPQDPTVNEDRKGGRYRLELNQEVRASVGSGGPDMTFKTWNGDIFIRRSEN